MNTNKLNLTINADNREIVTSRVFDAPRDMVYKAFTDPKLIAQWWGQRNSTTTVDKHELRPGGAWRYVQVDADGNQHAFNGIFREIVPTERLSYTFNYEPMPGHELVEEVSFTEESGKTRVTTRSIYQSVEDLYGMLQSGMEEGQNESYEQLDELLQLHNR